MADTKYNMMALLRQGAPAARVFVDCEKIYAQVHGHSHSETLRAAQNIGNTYKEEGHSENVLLQLLKSLEIQIREIGHEDLTVAASYASIGSVYQEQGKLEQALEYYRKDLEIKIQVLGHEHTDVATSKYNMAIVHEVQ